MKKGAVGGGARTDLACPQCGGPTRTLAVLPSREEAGANRTRETIGRACLNCGYETLDQKERKIVCAHTQRQAVNIRGEPPRRSWLPYGERCRKCRHRFPGVR